MLSTIPENKKAMANSITQFSYNFLGYLPAPIVYGLVCRFTGGAESRWGLGFLMIITLGGVYFLRQAKMVQDNIENGDDNNVSHIDRKDTRRKTEAIIALYGRVSMM